MTCGCAIVTDMCFLGTTVFSGSATVVATATGKNTYFASLSKQMGDGRIMTRCASVPCSPVSRIQPVLNAMHPVHPKVCDSLSPR